jgi:tetratricopeptide (TPR) repeat protein
MLHRETNGNPYFTREMLRHLVESGQLARTEGRWRATGRPDAMDLPGSVRDVLTQRVARLGAAATDVLTTASVIGRDVELDLLLLSIDQDEDELLDLLDAAVEARLLVETEGPRPGYTFAHALVEHTLYASLSQARRASRHRRVGEALERLCAGRPGSRIGELAHHWVRAGGADGEKALSYAIAAGDHAAAQVASQEAARWYASALQLLDESTEPDQRRRRDVLIGLGVAQRDSGEPGHRETLLKAARLSGEAHDAERLVRAALANSRGWVSASGQVDAERVAVLEAALATVGEDDRDSRERPLLLATLAAELAFSPPDVERRQMLADEALAAARRIGDALLLARVVSRSFVPTLLPERFDERLRSSAEGVAAAERAGDSVTLAHNLNWYAYALFEAGRMAEAGACWARQQELASELRQPTLQWQAAYNKAGHAIVLGHLDEAEQLAGDALQTGTASSQPDALPFYASQLISIRFDQGRLAEMQPFLAQTVEQNPGIPAFRSLLALASAEGDMDEEARRLLLDEAASDFSALPRDLTWINGIGIYALTCAHVEEAGPALALRAALVPFPDLVITSGLSWWGIAGHHIGNLSRVLGDHDASVEHLERASAAYARMETPVWMARVQLDTARALVARGRKGDARRAENLRTQAEARARAVGSATLMRRAHELRTSARVTS